MTKRPTSNPTGYPKSEVLFEIFDKKTYNTFQVLKSKGFWAVLLDGQPINLKAITTAVTPKYKRVGFTNKRSAIALAKRLNKQFNTDKFEVYSMNPGTVIDLGD